MIGLGSNRLTVCRRGGMSVTQAGRGGMEWLAGGRMPSWASPYSAQATAALQAQFPTQWPTIRDYGFAHPEIVGYMNAYAPEDAKIAYSLVEGIGVRYLVGNQGKYFKLGIKPSEDMSLKLAVRCATNATNRLFYVRNNYSDGSEYGFWVGTNNVISAAWGRGSGTKTISFNRYGYVVLEVNKDGAKMNGESFSIPTSGSFKSVNIEFVLPALNQSAGIYQDAHTNEIVSLEIRKTGASYWFIPIKRNGVMELIDLVSGNLATRVGTFTELIESPS